MPFLVKNIDPNGGRVQILKRGRPTKPGHETTVDVIDQRLRRLKEKGFIEYRTISADAGAVAPASAAKGEVAVPKAVETAVATSGTVKISDEVSFNIDKVKEELAKAEDEPATTDETPEADAEVSADEAAVDGDDPLVTPLSADDAELQPEPEQVEKAADPRIVEERSRLEAMDWADIKEEATSKGVKGRSRDNIQDKLLEIFVDQLPAE